MSFVHKSIPEFTVVMGVPARKIAERNRQILEMEQKFWQMESEEGRLQCEEAEALRGNVVRGVARVSETFKVGSMSVFGDALSLCCVEECIHLLHHKARSATVLRAQEFSLWGGGEELAQATPRKSSRVRNLL